MDKDLKLQLLKSIVSSCFKLVKFERKLYGLGIDINESAINQVHNELMDNICMMYHDIIDDRKDDEIIYIMNNHQLSEDDMLKQLMLLLDLAE